MNFLPVLKLAMVVACCMVFPTNCEQQKTGKVMEGHQDKEGLPEITNYRTDDENEKKGSELEDSSFKPVTPNIALYEGRKYFRPRRGITIDKAKRNRKKRRIRSSGKKGAKNLDTSTKKTKK